MRRLITWVSVIATVVTGCKTVVYDSGDPGNPPNASLSEDILHEGDAALSGEAENPSNAPYAGDTIPSLQDDTDRRSLTGGRAMRTPLRDGSDRDSQAQPPAPSLELDPCNEPTYADQSWQTHETPHFVLHYLEGTAAARNLEQIADKREDAYEAIRSALRIDEEPIIDVYLSPNRAAAAAHGRATGKAFPGSDRYEVVYTGAPDGYETVRYGHELTHVLAWYVGPREGAHLAILSEGIAEVLDESGRDLHRAYARKLNAGLESRAHLTSLQPSDRWGNNYGRAGSLAQLLVERHGFDAYTELLRHTNVQWSGGCYRHASVGCVDSRQALRAVLDYGLQRVVDESWEQLREPWRRAVEDALAEQTAEVQGPARDDAKRLLGAMDRAIRQDDASIYRKAMDGFYCQWKGEEARRELASRMVESYHSTSTELLALYPTGIKNFRTAYAIVAQREQRGVLSTLGVQLEHFPSGWRVTWMDSWR